MDQLSHLFRQLGNTLEIEEVLATLDQELRRLIAYDGFSVLLSESGSWTTIYASGDPQDFPVTEGRSGVTLQFSITLPGELDAGLDAKLLLYRHDERPFSAEDHGVFETLAPTLATALANARKYRRVEELAESDPWTGLANVRALFRRLDAELARARRSGSTLAVLHCAVEGFDHSGRLCAPSTTRVVFERVARRLRESCREYDFAARSGDGLVLVLPGFRAEFLSEKREMIQKLVEESAIAAGLPLFASVGAAFFPEDGSDAEDLLAAADRLKQRG